MNLFENKEKHIMAVEKEYLNTLKMCMESNGLKHFIIGNMGPNINILGQSEFNYDIAVRAIYYYYYDLKNIDICNKLNDAINILTNPKSISFSSMYRLIRFCEAHLYYEKNGKAPFKLNMANILLKLKNNLELNKEYYLEQSGNVQMQALQDYVNENTNKSL